MATKAKETNTEKPLGLVAQEKAAGQAATDATHLLHDQMNADEDLIDAAKELMRAIRNVARNLYAQVPCAKSVTKHQLLLSNYFTKYGVKLVPNLTYVGEFDLALEGYEPPEMVEMDVAIAGEQNSCGQEQAIAGTINKHIKETAWLFPQAGKGISAAGPVGSSGYCTDPNCAINHANKAKGR